MTLRFRRWLFQPFPYSRLFSSIIFLLSFGLLNARSYLLSDLSSDPLLLVASNRQHFLPSVFRVVSVSVWEAFGCSVDGFPLPRLIPLPHWPFIWLPSQGLFEDNPPSPSFNASLGGRVLVTNSGVSADQTRSNALSAPSHKPQFLLCFSSLALFCLVFFFFF